MDLVSCTDIHAPAECVACTVAGTCPDRTTDRPLCHCLRVSYDTVRQSIQEQNLSTVRSVTQACGAGGGCTACHRHIKRLIAEEGTRELRAGGRGLVESHTGAALAHNVGVLTGSL